ncbi:D-isomer specific 2-hydroxyacid dehydrogenase family protein [Marisediminicola sp. LYQ85]|uniref:D-isomer specific 2-hydroxyacid dehydrogenase family protein n=1 Tax=Marisediminicola sp. LYQ85 TaxID=3391062 RepID=UPI0039830BB1
MTMPSNPPQHRSVTARDADVVPDASRPTPGPIAVLPRANPVFVDAVEAGGGEVAELSAETRGVVWLSLSGAQDLTDILARYPQIEWVQLPWAGVDGFAEVLRPFAGTDLPLWTSAKGAYAQPVAEHALALTLGLLRVFPTRVRATSWSTIPEGRSLYGLSVVVVGAGGIAIEFLRLLEPFGATVTVVRRSSDHLEGADRTITADRLHTVLPRADVVVIAAALTEGTRHLFGAEQFDLMKDDAVLVNIARGGLVDTDALADALERGTIAGAGIDVTDPEPLPDGHRLWNAPNLIITPHSADTPDMTAPLLAERITANTEAFLDDGRFIGIVDTTAGY